MQVMQRMGAGMALLNMLSCSLDTTSPRRDERFAAPGLTGAAERPTPVTTSAGGSFIAAVRDTATVGGKKDSLAVIKFSLNVTNINAATAAHIHAGGPSVAGPVMVFLFSGPTTSNNVTRELANAEIRRTSAFTAPLTLDSVLARMRNGTAYVNVHTSTNPSGEIRGQIEGN